MLAIQTPKTNPTQCVPNILPCKINHNGPVNASKRHWNPETDNGVVLQKTEQLLPQTGSDSKTTRSSSYPDPYRLDDDNDNEQEDEAMIETHIANELGTFDEIMVWEHGKMPDKLEDAYTKGVGEWIKFAEAIHCEPKNGK